jgi:hypothetical protein
MPLSSVAHLLLSSSSLEKLLISIGLVTIQTPIIINLDSYFLSAFIRLFNSFAKVENYLEVVLALHFFFYNTTFYKLLVEL